MASSEVLSSTHRLIRMPGDGSCLFHSLSYLMYGHTQSSLVIRQSIVNYVCEHWDRLSTWTDDGVSGNYDSPEQYRREMLKSTTYGSSCELKAAAEMYQLSFRVYHDGSLYHAFGDKSWPVRTLRITGNVQNGHFDVYEPVSDQYDDVKLLIAPVVVLKKILGDNPSPENKPLSQKRVKRRGKFSDAARKRQLRDAAAKYARKRPEVNNKSVSMYSQKNPSVNRKAVSKYVKKKPEVHRKAVSTYVLKKPEVHRKAVSTYALKKPEVHRKAVSTYALKKPEAHRKAVSTYTLKNPEVHRKAVSTYAKKHPNVNRKSVSNYVAKHPEVHRASVRQNDPENEKRLQRKKKPRLGKENSAFKYDPEIPYEEDNTVNIGRMDLMCMLCKAKKWKSESPGICCSNGKIYLPPFNSIPEPLNSLIFGNHPESEHFLNSIRKYNSSFQMTSFGAETVNEGGFMPTFKVKGQVYHLIGSLLPSEEDQHKFLQIYFVGDEEKEANIRCANSNSLKPHLIKQLQRMFHDCNSYIRDLKTTIDSSSNVDKEFHVVLHADKRPTGEHRGRFNAPSTNEVGLVIVGQRFEHRDIVLKSRDDKLQRISEVHKAYDALQYPLMFCHGEDGYSVDIPQTDPVHKTPLSKTVSAANFYSYRLMIRDGEPNHLTLYRGLLSQFLVDMYAKIETERLNYIRFNQQTLRAESYVHLKDAVSKNDANLSDLGQVVILPSSFTGGPRYMHERTQDAMTYVRHHGRPDLFITFTCNPKWEEITIELKPNQKPQDRHDLISRVFNLKVKSMMALLRKDNIFGLSTCFMYTIEWQKRGLPHVHILLWLAERVRPEEVDKVICAEIPDPELDPKLHDIVKATMIHGPCGCLNPNSPCMANGKCSKKFPRPLLKDTQTGDDGYPQYRRRAPSDGGTTVNINGTELDNRWVVPYNPVLSRTFNAHINVELCNSVKSIKYICKYVNKGSDQAVFSVQKENDEISKYETGRYISSSEAAWRIFCFPIHEHFPPVMHLSVHLENGQRVYFTEANVVDKLSNPQRTTLLAFFDLCKHDEFAKTLFYHEVPSYFVWKNGKFTRRKQGKAVQGYPGLKKEQVLGRVYTIHPNNAECYFLRLLLHEVRGPTSFEDLKTVDHVLHPTFKSACRSLGLLEDDHHWDHTMEEACVTDSPSKLRDLFAVLLIFCQVSDPLFLWNKFKDYLSEDLKRQLQRDQPGMECDATTDLIHNQCLILLEDVTVTMSGQSLSHYGLPSPSRSQCDTITNPEYLRELAYDTNDLCKVVSENEPKLNTDQRMAYENILQSIEGNAGNVYFLDAPGGTGKTFLINLLLSKLRKDKRIVIAVASSGIAATLLQGGRTAHSALKLPINLNHTDTAVCNISKQSNTAQVLRDCELIVWDECTMANKKAVEALDVSLQDIRNNKRLMGGMTVVLAGDFRQTLPIVPRGTRADEVKACLKSSHLWPMFKVLNLKMNMRVCLYGDQQTREFSNFLMNVGNGTLMEDSGNIQIPKNLCVLVPELQLLIQKVYPDVSRLGDKHKGYDNLMWLRERAILTSKNDTATEINNLLLSTFTAETMTYNSFDSVVDMDDAVHYPTEFLHSLNPPGIPAHHLTLKVGTPIMLLRNLNPPKLCNGTRLQVKSLHRNVIEATIATGCGEGETVFIPRIPLIPTDYPFQFKRVQFPVRVCFAMTINKAQGQTLKVVGVDLRQDCFSHGQLYVSFSRVSSANCLIILRPDGQTRNIVYKEVLTR